MRWDSKFIFIDIDGGYLKRLPTVCGHVIAWKVVSQKLLFGRHCLHSASAAWLTGGSVDKIEVYQNEGGVTHFRNGIRPCIIPAGYVGVSLWGGVFVALSGSRVTATIAASVFCFALLVCLR